MLPGFTDDRGALFSPCQRYRYTLWRKWDTGPLVNFLMLNPSTADVENNDPTVERCERRAKSWGYAGLVVTNLFAFRATDPAIMMAELDPIGPDNDMKILEVACDAALVVMGWGNYGGFRNRSAAVLDMLRQNFHWDKLTYLAQCKNGEFGHPLYIPYSQKPRAHHDGAYVGLPLTAVLK